MRNLHIILVAVSLMMAGHSLAASPKRGIGWDEKSVKLNSHHASLLSPGVSWVYTWAAAPGNPEVYADGFRFLPMAWNAAYDATKIRAYLKDHPETRYILGFNEPNFADQARLTPAEAAAAWPGLEAIAKEYDVKLVAPALNFSGSQVGGKIWGIYEWYNEFFRLYPKAKVDCLALHCYMNWYTATTWFATEYFYKDLFDSNNENFGKYPYLAKYLTDYKSANAHYPRMMLTEFCAWEPEYLPDVDFQIDQMTQKVQMLEQSDLVEGYAWFMANASGGPAAFPYMSAFQSNSASTQLSELGKVYVNMSDFDRTRYHQAGEEIPAKDYIDASIDKTAVKLRSNTEAASKVPLQIEIPPHGYCKYQLDMPTNGKYSFSLHCSAEADSRITLRSDGGDKDSVDVPATSGSWTDVTLTAGFPSGHRTIELHNTGSSPVRLNALTFSSTAGLISVTDTEAATPTAIYTLQGHLLPTTDPSTLSPGLYLLRLPDGSATKYLR